MSTLWIVSEDRTWLDTLSIHLRSLGDTRTGPPERAHWRDAAAPSLLVVVGAEAAPDDLTGLERLLEFLAGAPRSGAGAAPLIYVPAGPDDAMTQRIRELVDDRRVAIADGQIDPDEIRALGEDLLGHEERLPGLRERARRTWVRDRVELLYADLDLPSLRHAVSPRNAHRPVLLLGERGTARGLLARYVHDLAEPVRDSLVVLPAAALTQTDLEQVLLERTTGRRSSVYLADLDQTPAGVQEQLAWLLGASGLLGVEPIRWLASASRAGALVPALRGLGWLRVALPPLRGRMDREQLMHGLLKAWGNRNDRQVELDPEAMELMTRYAWPGNLRELEACIESSCARAGGGLVTAEHIEFGSTPLPSDALHRADRVETDLEPDVAAASSLEDLTDATFGSGPPAEFEAGIEDDLPAEGPFALPEPARGFSEEPRPVAPEPFEPEPELPEPEPQAPEAVPVSVAPAPAPAPPADARQPPSVADLLPALAEEIRQPLRAIRAYASLVDQRPDDASRRRELASLFEGDLGRLEDGLSRLERYVAFGDPRPGSLDLAQAVADALVERRDVVRANSLVILRELEHDAPPVHADPEQVRFAIDALLDRALRMVPPDGDVYVGTRHLPGDETSPARHRLLIRFHSPEEVLVSPEDGPGPRMPIEVHLARDLIQRAGGSFEVDASGAQDNLILVELPG